MFKIAVLVSGGGSNMAHLIQNGIKIDVIIADRKCNAENIAKDNNIDFFQFERKNISEKIYELLNQRNIDLVVLAGFLSILDGKILEKYENKIINIHPSLLPKYGGVGMYGLNVHKAVFENGEKESGCSVHFVTSKVDGGRIIDQERVNISKATSPEEIQKMVLEKEWILLSRVVKNLIKEGEI